MRFVYNDNLCNGCMACVTACNDYNNLSADKAYRKVTEKESTVNGKVSVVYKSRSCMNCAKPKCIDACKNNAIYREEDIVKIDKKKCSGCNECVNACPFGAIVLIDNTAFKCQMCMERIKKGIEPVCVKACPNDLIKIEK